MIKKKTYNEEFLPMLLGKQTDNMVLVVLKGENAGP